MKKRLIFPLLISGLAAVVAGIILIAYVTKSSRNQSASSTLSERAQEFVTKDSSRGTGLWSEVDISDPTTTSALVNDTQVSTPCFELSLPLQTSNQTTEIAPQKCTFRAKLLSPLGHLVIAKYTSAKPAEDTGITLRQSKPDLYKSQTLSPKKWATALKFTSSESVTIFAWQNTDLLTISFNNLARPQSIPDDLVIAILDSYQAGSLVATASSSQP